MALLSTELAHSYAQGYHQQVIVNKRDENIVYPYHIYLCKMQDKHHIISHKGKKQGCQVNNFIFAIFFKNIAKRRPHKTTFFEWEEAGGKREKEEDRE